MMVTIRRNPPFPIRKKIDVLNLPPDTGGHRAGVEPHRNQKNVVQRNQARAVERIADLGLKSALLGGGVAREARDHEVGGLDGVLDGARPVLPGQQPAAVEPRVQAACFQSIAKAFHTVRIFLNIGQKNRRGRARHEAVTSLSAGLERPQAVYHHGLAFLQALADSARHLPGGGPVTVYHAVRFPCRSCDRMRNPSAGRA